MKGYFITLEGVEGSGKSTQMNLIEEYLTGLGYQVITTYEPGDTEIGKEIRELLLNPDYDQLVSKAELLLYCAERAQHIAEVIKPALEEGKIVISDRYIDATVAYQGYGRGFDVELIKRLNWIATDGLEPNLTLLLDIDPLHSLERAKKVTEEANLKGDKMEAERISFHNLVREGYLTLADSEARIELINASCSVVEVFNQIKSLLNKMVI
ncbi:dTMP kinase [Natroniella sulfidigena]|uniref:dTMP kinase n=1 Tax=Natroniella sulfidigena TaxID=723921 RepID=UPI00200A6D16|nr:dTMP kinase [Natroniella sulfidigena]MCK8817093.1 dTMP kinase [Natroniella sulfidigena]